MTSPLERQRPQDPREILGPTRDYDYHPFEKVAEALGMLGLRPEEEHISGLYLHKNKATAVAVAEATNGMGEGHFGIIRGVDYLRMMDRTGKLRAYFAGDVQEGYAPHTVRCQGVGFGNLVATSETPHVLNIVAQRRSQTGAPYEVSAGVYSGAKLIASAKMLDSSIGNQRMLQRGYDLAIVSGRQRGELLEKPVGEALARFGYGENKMVLGSYLQREDAVAHFPIGGMRVTRENGEAFEFSFVEGLAQLLAYHLADKGYVNADLVIPTFGGITNMRVNAKPNYPSEIRLVMQDISVSGKIFSGRGQVTLHHDVLLEAEIFGRTMPKETLTGLIARRRRDQTNELPLFPKQ